MERQTQRDGITIENYYILFIQFVQYIFCIIYGIIEDSANVLLMKYLVTGGAGFVGSHVVDALIAKGDHVAIIDNLSSGKQEYLNPGATFHELDILDKECYKVFQEEQPEVVIHLAAHIEARQSVKDPMHDATINILGSLNILENCREFGLKRMVFASSGGEVYGQSDTLPINETQEANPLTPYGVAKLAVEKYLGSYHQLFGIPYAALRFGNIYGPRQSPHGEAGVVAIFLGKMLADEQCIIHDDGTQTKDYIYIDDVVSACISAANAQANGVFNIATGVQTSVLELFDILTRLTSTSGNKEHQQLGFPQVKHLALAIKKARQELGWEPTFSLEQGLQKTIEAVKIPA